VRLTAEIALARAVGRISRLTGRGGGTTLPGRLLAAVDPGAMRRLAGRLPLGVAVVSATNGKTTTAAMAAEILGGKLRLAHNRAGANLVSGIVSTLVEAKDAELGLFEVDEGALPAVARSLEPRALCLGNLFRDQLDRYGELELVAERWEAALAGLPAASRVVVNVDDPALARLAETRPDAVRFGLDDPSVARERLPHAADSKYCRRCGAPYTYAAAYVGHLGDYLCPGCGARRPPLQLAARSIAVDGLEGVSFELDAPAGRRRVALSLPGLYNVYNATAAAALTLELGASLDEVAGGLSRFRPAFGRFERIEAGGRTALVLLVKNPAGANEAVRTIVAGCDREIPVAVVALNDEIADGRDVSWIWDVDFEPLLDGLERLVATGERAAELALRFKYAGLDGAAIDVVPSLEDALDRALELTPPGGELAALPTYTAMLALRDLVAKRGFARPYWEQAA
jgi:lipid II isoglutaminyl synthase (glutamine-hydrolysing)